MPGQPFTKVVHGDGTGTLTFEVPSSYAVELESVLANVDASFAGDTTATLTVADQTGEQVAAIAQGRAVAGGGQGRATWALRLGGSGDGAGDGYNTVLDEHGVVLPRRHRLAFFGPEVQTTDDGPEDLTLVELGAGYDRVQDEATNLTKRETINFVGAGVTATDDPGHVRTNVTIPGAAGYNRAQDEGANLTQRQTFNFIGAGVTATDDAGNARTNVTIPGVGIAGDEWAYYAAVPTVTNRGGVPNTFAAVSGNGLPFVKMAGSAGSLFTTEPAPGSGESIPIYNGAGEIFYARFVAQFDNASGTPRVVQTELDDTAFFAGVYNQLSAALMDYSNTEGQAQAFGASANADPHLPVITEAGLFGLSHPERTKTWFRPWLLIRTPSITGWTFAAAQLLVTKLRT